MPKFLIVTTNDLPEAYYLAEYLLLRRQKFAIINILGRTTVQKLIVLNRIRKKRGLAYVVDLSLGKIFRSRYQNPDVVPFPHLTAEEMHKLKVAVTTLDVHDPHTKESLNFVREFAPDYILIAGAPVLNESFFGLARVATLNRHLGLAPEYRGSDCPLWVLRHKRFDRIGYTIHLVTKNVDGGRVLLQRAVVPTQVKNFSEFLAHINRQGSEGYVEVLEQIIDKGLMAGDKQTPGGKYYPPAGLKTIRQAWLNWQEFTLKQK